MDDRTPVSDLITFYECAELLGRSYGGLRVSKHHGRLPVPCIKVGVSVMFRRSDVVAYLEAREAAAS